MELEKLVRTPFSYVADARDVLAPEDCAELDEVMGWFDEEKIDDALRATLARVATHDLAQVSTPSEDVDASGGTRVVDIDAPSRPLPSVHTRRKV
jgi:hypothetical protein